MAGKLDELRDKIDELKSMKRNAEKNGDDDEAKRLGKEIGELEDELYDAEKSIKDSQGADSPRKQYAR